MIQLKIIDDCSERRLAWCNAYYFIDVTLKQAFF